MLFREKIDGKVHAFSTEKHPNTVLVSKKGTTIQIDTTTCTQEDLKKYAAAARTALGITVAATPIAVQKKTADTVPKEPEPSSIQPKEPPSRPVQANTVATKTKEEEGKEKAPPPNTSIMQEVKKEEKKVIEKSTEEKEKEKEKEIKEEEQRQEQHKEVKETAQHKEETKEVP